MDLATNLLGFIGLTALVLIMIVLIKKITGTKTHGGSSTNNGVNDNDILTDPSWRSSSFNMFH